MKKSIALFIALAFVVTLAAETFAQRDPAEELEAVRGYLKTLDVKIIKYKALKGAKAAAVLADLRAQKNATLKRLADLKAQVEAVSAPAAPVAPPPAPVAVKPAPTGAAPLFGLGLNSNLSGLYLYNNGKGFLGTLLGRFDLVLDDPLALGSLVGLSANSVKYRVGLGGVYGKDNSDANIGAIPVFADAVVSLPADMMGGIESYVGGGVNYNLYGTGRKSGPYGIQAYYGLQGDLGLGLGKTTLEIGYSVLRASGRSSKGIAVAVGMPLVL